MFLKDFIKMHEESYWTQFQPIEYNWHITVLIAYLILFFSGLILNVALIVYFLK